MADGTATAPVQAAPSARPVRRLRTEPSAMADGTVKKPGDHGNLSAISDL
ncbi:hypothetical protein OG607_09550 [Streptomyces sp. NBC_01537]